MTVLLTITDNLKLYVTTRSIINWKIVKKCILTTAILRMPQVIPSKSKIIFGIVLEFYIPEGRAYCKNVNLVVLSIDGQE